MRYYLIIDTHFMHISRWYFKFRLVWTSAFDVKNLGHYILFFNSVQYWKIAIKGKFDTAFFHSHLVNIYEIDTAFFHSHLVNIYEIFTQSQ